MAGAGLGQAVRFAVPLLAHLATVLLVAGTLCVLGLRSIVEDRPATPDAVRSRRRWPIRRLMPIGTHVLWRDR
jgi:hypothetical protein